MSVYADRFAKRMEMAGLKPHHRIAITVSGGSDGMALCVLTAAWKTETCDAAISKRSKRSVGIKCEVARCEWLDGRPKPGHLQEAAHNKRYDILQNTCVQQQIGILLVAHHEDDQAELFILRLSQNSGVLGLAGMAFTSQMFPVFPDFSGEALKAHGILLVQPLLEFSKEDMYNLHSRLILEVVSSCRKTRICVDKHCRWLVNQAVTVMPHGYAIIDPQALHLTEVKELCFAKFIALVVQFISQIHQPVRGKALKLLLDYLRTFPCKHKEFVSLKSIPVAARRALPVLVSPQGVLLSITSVGFARCPRMKVAAVYYPRVPLGGGHSLFL